MSTLFVIYMLICSIAVPAYGAVKLFKYLKIKQMEKEISKGITNISPTPLDGFTQEDMEDEIKNIFGNFEIGGKK